MANKQMQLQTKLIHAGHLPNRLEGAVTMPIFQTSTYEYNGEATYDGVKYARLSNTPNHLVLHERLAQVEGSEAALVTASGMAAISCILLTTLSRGDHLLIQDQLYGGTYGFLTEDLARLGIEYTLIDGRAPQTWASQIRPNTKVIYGECISNPLLRVLDLKAMVSFAREHKLVSVVDNTFLTPVNLRPIEWGIDVVVHSATKYLNGHSDICAGVIAGRKEWVDKALHLLNHLGGSLDPHAAFLLERGMKTLVLRVHQQNQNALGLARFLTEHRKVRCVHYPLLKNHPDFALSEQFLGGAGGVLSFEVTESAEWVDRMMDRLQFAICAPSLGGVETLITRPVTTSHAGVPPEVCKRNGITENLVRVAVGIEALEDLVADFDQALASPV